MDESFLNVDRYGSLKPPASWWLMMAVLLRQWLLLVVVLVLARRSPESVEWAYSVFSWQALVIELPVLLLAIASTRRLPQSGPLLRHIWKNGRHIVAASVAMSAAWASWYLAQEAYWAPWPERAMATLVLIEVTIAVTVWRSPYFKQLFQEFPTINQPTTESK
jgi:hypothetical protein